MSQISTHVETVGATRVTSLDFAHKFNGSIAEVEEEKPATTFHEKKEEIAEPDVCEADAADDGEHGAADTKAEDAGAGVEPTVLFGAAPVSVVVPDVTDEVAPEPIAASAVEPAPAAKATVKKAVKKTAAKTTAKKAAAKK